MYRNKKKFILFFTLPFPVLSIEPETVTFNKEGNEIIGRIILKNVTTDKALSYKVRLNGFFFFFCYFQPYLSCILIIDNLKSVLYILD